MTATKFTAGMLGGDSTSTSAGATGVDGADNVGSDDPDANNIHEVVIPVLNNIIACSMKLYEYQKAILFCQQLLKFSRNNYKGCYRMAQCYIHTGNYSAAVTVLNAMLEVHEQEVEKGDGDGTTAVEGEGEGEGVQPYTVAAAAQSSSVDLADAALDDVGQTETWSEAEATGGEELPAAPVKAMAKVKTNADFIKGLRQRAYNGMEREKLNKLRQNAAMRAAFAPAKKQQIPSNDATSSTNQSDNDESSTRNGSGVIDVSAPAPAFATGIESVDKVDAKGKVKGSWPLRKQKKTSAVEDIAVILLYVSVLMCISAIIVRAIVHAPVSR